MTLDIWIYYVILLVGIVWGFAHFKQKKIWLRFLTLAFLLAFLSEIVSRYLAYEIQNSFPPYHFFNPINYVLMACCYYYLHPRTDFMRYYVPASSIILVCFSIINSIYLQELLTFPSNPILLGGVFILVMILYSYLQMLKYPNVLPLLQQAQFWFNTGNLLMFAPQFFYWAFFNFLMQTGDFPQFIFDFFGFITIASYFLLAVSLYFGYKKDPNGRNVV